MTLPNYRKYAAKVVEKIDMVSRTRMLTEDESRVLEHFIGIVDGTVSAAARMPFRGNIILARMGVKRDMTLFQSMKRPNKRATSRKVVLRKVRRR